MDTSLRVWRRNQERLCPRFFDGVQLRLSAFAVGRGVQIAPTDDLGNFHQHFRNSSTLRGRVTQMNKGGGLFVHCLCLGALLNTELTIECLRSNESCFDVSGSLLRSSDDQARTCSVNGVLISALGGSVPQQFGGVPFGGVQNLSPGTTNEGSSLPKKKKANKSKFEARGFLPEGTFAFFCSVSDTNL